MDNSGRVSALQAEIKRLDKLVEQLSQEPKVVIDEWDKVLNSEHEGPYITMYFADGREYIGHLRLYKDEEGTVVDE